MSNTNFNKVQVFNKLFGIETTEVPSKDIFTTKPKLINYRLALINEEVKELNEAVESHDLIETIDALADILYVVYGAFTAIGINADEAFQIVQESNMSKLCKDEDEAKLTVESYIGDERYDSPTYRLSEDGQHYVVYNKSTIKILKNVNYKPAGFGHLL